MTKSNRMPGKLAHAAAVTLTLMLTLMLTLTALTWPLNRVLTDRSLHEEIATDDAVVTMQMERIEKRVKELAETYFFRQETVMQLITKESLAEYNRQAVGWWMGLMEADPVIEPPQWDTDAIEQAVREDELFKEKTAANLRRTTARDQIAYEIGREVDRAVLPVRADILAIVMPRVLEKVDVPAYMGYLSLAFRLCGAVSLVLTLLVLLVMHKRPSKAWLYIGAGMAAAGLSIAIVCGALRLLDVKEMIGDISGILATQAGLLTGKMMLSMGVLVLVLLSAGLVLMGAHRADMRRLERARGAQG